MMIFILIILLPLNQVPLINQTMIVNDLKRQIEVCNGSLRRLNNRLHGVRYLVHYTPPDTPNFSRLYLEKQELKATISEIQVTIQEFKEQLEILSRP